MPYLKLLQDEFIIKLIILFVFKHYNKPMVNQNITDLVLQEVEIDYFDMQKCLYDLVKIDWIRVFMEDGLNKYELTEQGLNSVDYFIDKIPYLIKQKLQFAIKKKLSADEPKTAVESDIIVSEKGEFNVFLKIYETGDLLFELNINVGSRELAQRTKEHFLKNALEIYMETTKNIMKNIN